MLPFLLIQTRSDDSAAADELRSTTELGGFAEGQLAALRLDQEMAPHVGEPGTDQRPGYDWSALLAEHSGVILCGSPYNSSDPDELKSDLQLAVEAELRRMLDVVVEQDVPFMGACYGVGTLGLHQGATVDGTYGEPAGVVSVSVTEAGSADPLLEGVDPVFDAYVGHKEAVSRLPEHAVVLVRGESCPVQMFRIGQNMYATQFHPELDQEGLLHRLEVYADRGYFDPAEADQLFASIRASVVTQPQRVLSNFVRRYAQ